MISPLDSYNLFTNLLIFVLKVSAVAVIPPRYAEASEADWLRRGCMLSFSRNRLERRAGS